MAHSYRILLRSTGPTPDKVIDLLATVTGIDAAKIKQLLANSQAIDAPLTGISADDLAAKLKALGAQPSIRPHAIVGGHVTPPQRVRTTPIGQLLTSHGDALQRANVTSFHDLRSMARRPVASLRGLGLDDDSQRMLRSFAALARTFPPDLAAELHDAGAQDLDDVAKWSEAEFATTLRQRGVAEEQIAFELARLQELKRRIAAGEDAEKLTGLALDLGDDGFLSTTSRNRLNRAGIETLVDWSQRREMVDLPANTAQRLDAYARLSTIGIANRQAKSLIDAGLQSAVDLARLPSRERAATATAAGMKVDELDRVIRRAQTQSTRAAEMLDRTLGVAERLPRDIGKIIDAGLIGKVCVECADENSAFSRFAYFVYLVQRTGQTADELKPLLKLDVDLKELSPNAADELRPDPLAACATISLLDLVIRRLQEHLDHLRATAPNVDLRRDYVYLSYAIWRSERVAHYFPEASALWRDDVLTSQSILESRDSILLQRAETRPAIDTQLAAVRSALAEARLAQSSGPFTDTQFDQLPAFTNEPYYDEFLRGVALIEAIMQIDDTIQAAVHELDQDFPGVALTRLQEAAAQLDGVARDLFPVNTAWHLTDISTVAYYSELIDRPPAQRKAHIEQAFDDLMSGFKRIYAPLAGAVEIEGLREDGAPDLGHGAWNAHNDFEQTPGGVSIPAGSSATPRTLRNTRGDELEDYGVAFNFEWNGFEGLPVDPNFVVAITLRQASNQGYRLSIKPKGVYIDDDFSGTEFFLVLERLNPTGGPTELAREWFGYDRRYDEEDKGIRRDQVYGLRFEVSGPLLRGRLRINGSNIIEIEDEDTAHDKGSFAISAGGGLNLHFTDFSLQTEQFAGLVPFFAPNRQSDPNFNPTMALQTDVYYRHRVFGHGMSTKLMALPLTRPATTTTAVELLGAQRGGSRLYVVFKAGSLKVDNQALDYMLERALAGLFFLRYAVIPTRMAQALAQSGEYAQAIDLLHLLYDDTAPGGESARQIYGQLAQPEDSLGRVLSPDVRLLRLRLADLYLTLAEWLFRQDSDETRHQARRLCERVKALHNMNCDCEGRAGTVVESILDRWLKAVPNFDADDLLLDDPDRFVDLVGSILDNNGKLPDPADLLDLIDDHDPGNIDPVDFKNDLDQIEKTIENEIQTYHKQVDERITYAGTMVRGDALLRAAEVRSLGLRVDDPFVALRHEADGPGTAHQTARYSSRGQGGLIGGLIGAGGDDFHRWEWEYGEWRYPAFCVPANPLRVQQVKQACLMLDLINNCRNILGFADTLVPPLRFEALIRIARGFADQAGATERDLFQVRQNFEQYRLSLLEAESSLAVSEGDVALETLNVDLAASDVRQSYWQQAQTADAVSYYGDLLAAGLSDMEQLSLNAAWTSAVFSGISAGFSVLSAAPALVGAVVAGAGLAQMGTGVFASTGSITTAVGLLGTVAGGPQSLATASGSIASAASATSAAASMQASFERRAQEWAHRHVQEQFNLLMAQEGITQAVKRLEIAQLRRQIAAIKRTFAADAVRFLSHKFLNTSMWIWLQRTLREQYRTRLHYAITAGYMAERALAFELQNQALRTIRFDYFDPRHDGALGATQLQTDLATLENTRLALTQRKLELSRTFSLAQLFPLAFARFQSGDGRLPFSTAAGAFDANDPDAAHLLDLFDREYPGHYMRLIRSVKVTVVALVPPHSGIRATLHNSGLSRVVVGPPYQAGYREVTVRRNPESVALTAPFQASGLFALDPSDELLLPFEGLGVASDWVLELPKAANPFDFRTIADVLVTFEYTALESRTYRQAVVARLDNTVRADRAISLRHHYPDLWYHLHNPVPAQPAPATLDMELALRASDFPANLANITIQHVALAFLRTDGSSFEMTGVELNLARPSGTPLGGSADTSGGVISTRQASGAAWTGMAAQSPLAQWTLRLPNTDAVRKRLRSDEAEHIEDILLVISYRADMPAWPASG